MGKLFFHLIEILWKCEEKNRADKTGLLYFIRFYLYSHICKRTQAYFQVIMMLDCIKKLNFSKNTDFSAIRAKLCHILPKRIRNFGKVYYEVYYNEYKLMLYNIE